MTVNDIHSHFKSQFGAFASDFGIDGDSTADEGVIYFTLATDTTGNAYLDLPNSAVCVEDETVVEFDLRIGEYDVDTVERAIPRRYRGYPEAVDTGHGPGDITHIRAFNTMIPIDDFVSFVTAVMNRLPDTSD